MLVLLDRDGVINRDTDSGVLCPEDFHLLPRVPEAIALLKKHGFHIAVCTNQSAIGRGLLSEEGLAAIHDKMQRQLSPQGGMIDAIYYAPDHPHHTTSRRKPGPGMLQEAIAKFGADPVRTPMVGDMLRDLEAAHAAGCPAILVRSGKGEKTLAAGIPGDLQPVIICSDLYDAAEYIVEHYAGASKATC